MLIVLEHLSKTFYTGAGPVHALRDINLGIDHGEFVAIIGQSGSGKTTLLDILGCLSHPTEGEYWLDGDCINELGDGQLTAIRNKKIGFVFQTFHLLPRKTAQENVQLPLMYAGASRRAQIAKARELLKLVGLEDRMTHYTNQLSGGQQQRVAIARALANQPAIVLADEPTGNLDSQSGNAILEIFDHLHQAGQTIVIITHDPFIAQRADRCITLADGQVVTDVPSHPHAGVLV